MNEVLSNKLNPQVLPHHEIWAWEVPIYLFLGGLAGGLLVITGGMLLLQKGGLFGKKSEDREAFSGMLQIGSILAPVLLGLGMFFLFLDLEYKFHVWRFYTAFVWTSPMSWGSWMLIIFFPLATLQAVIVNERWVGGINLLRNLIQFTKPHLNLIAMINVHMGAGIGVYTGILLSTFYARPIWSSSILGFVFLMSGLSSAAALVMLMAPRREKLMFSKMDMYFISLEGFATTLFIIGGITGSENIRDAMFYLISGPYAPWFWVVFVLGGMIVPLMLETLEAIGRIRFTVLVPLLVLTGSLTLRFIIVYAGQAFPTFA